MKFHIPFTFSKLEKLKKKKIIFKSLKKYKKDSKLSFYLENSDSGIEREQYLNITIKSLIINFILSYIILTTVFALFKINLFYLLSLISSFAFAGFIFFSQMIYPKIYFSRRQRNIEKNLVSALEDMLVQLSSGVPLFNIMVNISVSDYGELSEEFKKAVRKINAGIPQTKVIEEMSEKNQSNFFKRTLWQLSNGMRAGSDISLVISESIKLLNQEQIVQVQNYGNKLNPLIMFYMLVTIILPALAITFLTIIASMIGLGKSTTTGLYIGMFIFIILIQIMFLGAIRSARPSLI